MQNKMALVIALCASLNGCTGFLSQKTLATPVSKQEITPVTLSLSSLQVGTEIRQPTFEAKGECPETIIKIALQGDVVDSPLLGDCNQGAFAFPNATLAKDGVNEIVIEGYDTQGRLAGRGRFTAVKNVATFKLLVPAVNAAMAAADLSNRTLSGQCSWQGAKVKVYYDHQTYDPDIDDFTFEPKTQLGEAVCQADYTWSFTSDLWDFDEINNSGAIKLYLEEWQADATAALHEIDSVNSLDYSPPTPGRLVIGADVDVVNSNDVVVHTHASTDAVDMYITTDATCASGGAWEPNASTKLFHLDIANGKNQVYAKFRDEVGNESWCVASTPVSLKAGEVVLSSHFPGFANWFSFVARPSVSGQSYMDVSPTTCYGGWTNMPTCTHAGELKKVEVPNLTSCTGVSATDVLGAFQWDCTDNNGLGPVAVRSTGLQPRKGLKDLVTEAGWRSNSVTIVTPTHTYHTASEAWWSEPVLPLPDNSTTARVELTTANTIYALGTSRSTKGYRIKADHVGIAILDGATLSLTPGAANNCGSSSYSGSPEATDGICLIYSWLPSWAWIEGDFDATGTTYGINFVYSNYNRLRNVRIKNALQAFQVNWCDGVMVEHSRFDNFNQADFTIGFGLFLHDVTFANSNGTIGGWFAHNEIWTNVRFINVGTGSNYAWYNHGGSDSTLSHISFINSSNGIILGPGSGTNGDTNTFNQILMLNSGTGFNVQSHDNIFSQIAVAGTTSSFAFSSQGNNTKALGNIIMNGANCTGSPTNSAISGSTCSIQNGSLANLVTGIDSTASIVGKVTANDTTNVSDTAGLATYAASLDFFNFDSLFRGWGVDGSAGFPNSDQQGRCTSGSCRIWDATIQSSDTTIRNRSGNGVTANDTFTVGGACPSAVDGAVTVADGNNHVFLANAVEIRGDGLGDDNGLCENGEACIYSPHIGAYQGSGDYNGRSCIFHDGPTVKNVKMYAYPNL